MATTRDLMLSAEYFKEILANLRSEDDHEDDHEDGVIAEDTLLDIQRNIEFLKFVETESEAEPETQTETEPETEQPAPKSVSQRPVLQRYTPRVPQKGKPCIRA